ncbi:Lysosomal Pro X carboxypeptidase [Paragonimus heterotremus]|uniref:Lysosomal Pro X carboxypeptidase n=1 Tax=Paragonimus heterotremus TaxID=100268 RepID=A0A8J4WG19_9TREM|nr:Lysosomal Pro X carboxypeptidase [Paragonimus heterotremus]
MFGIIFFLLSLTCCFTRSPVIPWPPKEGYITQAVDHFSFHVTNLTYDMRYLYDDQWYEPGGPIFFYCGNEGPIESFWNNTGYMFYLASTMKALVVFAEHRYYGKSLPFPRSFIQPCIQYLSVDQALADFVYLIDHLKHQYGNKNTLVIAFGGSYGGMLAAYMRVKYPHMVAGAIASSAPVKWVAGSGNFHEFFESVTNDYKMVRLQCVDKFKEAYTKMEKMFQEDPKSLASLSQQLRLCKPMETTADFMWMLKWSRNAFVMMAMMDYPYTTSFMADLPAYPVNVSCEKALAASDPIDALRDAIAVMYNSSKKLECFDYKTDYVECADITGCGLGDSSLAWDFQSCTEMNLYDPSNATSEDMFPSLPLTKEDLTNYCKSRWGVTPAFRQLANYYGPNIWKYTSNIFFANGDLDPWRAGGVLESLSPTVVAMTIHGGAHHLDLRMPDPNDPPSAREVRQAELTNILSWINQAHF